MRPERVATPQPRALSPVERKEIKSTSSSPTSSSTRHRPPSTPSCSTRGSTWDRSPPCTGSSTSTTRCVNADARPPTRPTRSPSSSPPDRIRCGAWDITKLHGPEKWTYYYLYVILDIYSRYAVGWMLARAERAELSKRLITDTIAKQGVAKDQLTLHSDRGSPMIAKPVAHLLADLGVTKSHSRPHVSNDNPYSESQFRTFKYRPDFPDRFGSFEDARAHCARFFRWYNDDHRHSGIGLHTPADVHYGRAEAIRDRRGVVLLDAYAEHPERFVRKTPTPPAIPGRRVDQPTRSGGHRLTESMNEICLKKVDMHRAEGGCVSPPRPRRQRQVRCQGT